MIAVLVESRKPGRSGWVRVRDSSLRLKVVGLDKDDILYVMIERIDGSTTEHRAENGVFPIPRDTLAVCAEHRYASGGRVCVDLVREWEKVGTANAS